MAVMLALRKNDERLVSRFIAWWTNSIYSHCELVVGGVSYSSSAMDGGVRGKIIDMPPDKWDFLELPWADADGVIKYFKETDHHKYGWLGLITGQLFNLNRAKSDTQFCSQWCAGALGIPNATSYSPETLSTMVNYITAVHKTLHNGDSGRSISTEVAGV